MSVRDHRAEASQVRFHPGRPGRCGFIGKNQCGQRCDHCDPRPQRGCRAAPERYEAICFASEDDNPETDKQIVLTPKNVSG